MLRWSDTKWALPAYVLAAALAVAELAILWLALHPNVSAPYRAYYIDRTTTCLPQPVTGAYTWGQVLDFRSGGDETREVRPCGWQGPAGDGMHSLGETSRLRLATGPAQDMTLMLQFSAVDLPGPTGQRVIVSINGTEIGAATLPPGATDRFEFAVPAAALGDTGYAEIALDYPDAIAHRPDIANTYKRAIKLLELSLGKTPPA